MGFSKFFTELLPSIQHVTIFFTTQVKKVAEYLFALVIFVTLVITISSAFVFHNISTIGLNVFFIFCIILACFSNIGLVIQMFSKPIKQIQFKFFQILQLLWKKRYQSEETKLTILIYFNFVNIFLLCICANLYQHGYWVLFYFWWILTH